MNGYIRLYVKFRVGGWTITSFDKTWKIGLPDLLPHEVHTPYPEEAHVVYNDHGIKLSIWQ